MGKLSKPVNHQPSLASRLLMVNNEVNDGCKSSVLLITSSANSFHTGSLSDHNNGKGISFTVQFTPLPKAGKKRWKNAASQTVSRIIFIHEDMGFRDMITVFTIQLKRQDFFQDLEIIDDKITQAPFDIHYTIPRTASKNIQLLCADDYATLL
jgi:hypothetical protein